MNLYLTERFQEDLDSFPEAERDEVWRVILALPGAFREPTKHTGLGLRKLHPGGIWEARVGLRLRVVFGLEKNLLVFRRAGDHGDVTRYLRSL